MNQQILFNDNVDIHWDERLIIFYGQWAGQMIPCIVTFDALQKRTEQPLNTEAQIQSAFEMYRFELEEEAETLIEEEAFDPQGQIWLTTQAY